MKRYVIERRVNPFDSFIKYKQFDTLQKVQQSLNMLNKHIDNLLKDIEYMKYRIYDKATKQYLV